MNDGGGRGQQLMMRREIYFRSYRGRSPKYPRVYPDIQAGLLRSITLYYAESVRMRHISYPAPDVAFTAGCLVAAGTEPCGPSAAELADRRGPPSKSCINVDS
jgi:hypothetical protein